MAFRFGRAPLLRGVLVGGAAYSMGKRGAMNRQQEQEQNAQIAELQQQQNAQQQPVQQPVQQPATSPATDDPTMAQLTQLGQMRQQGLLTDAEFTAAKAKLLGI